MNNIDNYAKWFINFLLSKTIILISMILFLSGIVQHINDVFDNWFLSISCQFVILLTTINSRYLPSIKTKYGIDIPFLGLFVSLFMFWFIYYSLDSKEPAELLSLPWILHITESLFFAGIELIFAYLCTTRIYEDLKGTNEGKKINRQQNNIDNIDIDIE